VKKAVFLYDYTGIMAQPWLDDGYECWIFDGQHEQGITREGNLVKVGMWFYADKVQEHAETIRNMVGDGVTFVFGFPECTHLAVSGARHFAVKLAKNPRIQDDATELAKLVELVAAQWNCPWGAENPVSVLATKWRKPDHTFQPYEFGGYLPADDMHSTHPEMIKPRDAYPKKTCIWSGGGFIMPDKLPVAVDPGYSNQFKKLGGKSLRTKNIRSATPRGFAMACWVANRLTHSPNTDRV